jgi:GNAT superfamily N-acetyltransferase
MSSAPFVVFAPPGARSYWLAGFLTQGGWTCGHDEVRHARSLDDVQSWLSMPNTGTVEIGAAPFWRLLLHYRSDVRSAVVGRSAKLDQIAARVPGVLALDLEDLRTEEACARLFEHCLPFRHDPAWWAFMAPMDLQADAAATARYYQAHRPQLAKLAKQANHRTTTLLRAAEGDWDDGLTFQVEPFRRAYADATDLFAEHLVQTEQSPDDYLRKNVPLLARLDDVGALQFLTARSNGRMFGYLMTVVAPSLDSPDVLEAQHTIFFASPVVRNLGMRLQRAALEFLRARGVGEVIMRAGHRGSGPRLGAFYRRLGAEEFGQLYRLELENDTMSHRSEAA